VPKVLKGKESFFRLDTKTEKIRLGNGLNAWTIHPSLTKNSVVYSFGVGKDISFDLALIEKFGCTVHAFDPTPKSLEWIKQQETPQLFHIHPIGLASYCGKATFYPPENEQHISATMLSKPQTAQNAYTVEVQTLAELMKQLQHTQIDVLKMDIEGAEYEVIDNLLESNINISQLLIEFHHRFSEVGISKTKQAVNKLRKNGFKLFNVSDIGEEFSFIRL